MSPAELRARRQALGLTQEQLARRLGVTADAVVKWERGNRQPSPLLDLALAQVEAQTPPEERT